MSGNVFRQLRNGSIHLVLVVLLLSSTNAGGIERKYNYRIDLNAIEKHRFQVELLCEDFSQDTLVYHFPWMIPGTYAEANYGKYIHDFKAFDQQGKTLQVKKKGKNTFIITPASNIKSITYWVSATWGSKTWKTIWPMAGTGIIQDRVFAINAGGVFGYFHGQERQAIDMHYSFPEQLYAMTVLEQTSNSPGEASISTLDYHELIDSPILFAKPDTTSFSINNTHVLIGYAHESDDKERALTIKKSLRPSMQAIESYLDTLPAEEYAFLIYYADERDLGKILDNQRFLLLKGLVYVLRSGLPIGGALEHNKSSFYYLSDPGSSYTDVIAENIDDMSIHEFMHILTPLNLRTEPIQNWDYSEPVLSKHLWLYEGVTEYMSEIIQVNGGLTSPKDFLLKRMQRKIRNGEKFPLEKMSFTEMASSVLDKPYKKQYNQVYQRGAVMGMLLDIEIIRLTQGKKRLIDVMYELIDEYGPDRAMAEEQVFDLFTEKVHPDLRSFFTKYVEGREPLPYAEILDHVGVIYENDAEKLLPRHPINDNGVVFSKIGVSSKRVVKKVKKKDEIGFKAGDKVDRNIYLDNYFDDFGEPLPEGMQVSFAVERDSNDVTLSDVIRYREAKVSHQLKIMRDMTPEQSKYFNIWLGFEDPVRGE
ncbi:MAG: hypothetical protein K9M55_09095 [Candidatus Marinimicrobia bacterium]|nr:hypothetical protein [Candidatus Neomarinimicrobiota bacterium]